MNGKLKHRKGKSEGNKGMRNILFKNNNYSTNNNTRLKTTYNNNNNKTKINMKIINKKNANKREEILNTINKNEPYTIFRSSGLPPISFQKSLNHFYSPKHQFSIGVNRTYKIPSFMPTDKEGIILELYHVANDMDTQNKELDDLKTDYNNLINNSLAYKVIIEKILNLDTNYDNNNDDKKVNTLKNREKSKSDDNFIIINSIEENEEYIPNKTRNVKKNYKGYKYNNNSYITTMKNNKSKFIIKNINLNDKVNPITLNVLSKQKNDLDKILIQKEQNLIEIKNNEKNKNFDEYISLLNEKNTQLETLVNQSQKLRYKQYEDESQIDSYLTKIKKLNDEINSYNDKLKIHKNDLDILKRDIDSLLKYKEELKQKEVKLYENEKQNKNYLIEKQKKLTEINNLLQEKQKYFEEKQKIDFQIRDLQKQEDNMKKVLDKKNITIKGIKRDNEDLANQIEYYEERRNKLLEKADQPRKNRIRMKEMEIEIKELEKNIVTYKVENDEKEKNMEEEVKNNDEKLQKQEEEIDAHEGIVKELEKKINNLKNELKNAEDTNTKRGEELTKVEVEYKNMIEQNRIEKENKEKLKKEKDMEKSKEEEMKNKQHEEKINELEKNIKELSEEEGKLKVENDKIKEENKKLTDLHKKKMELYKLCKSKQGQLEKILNDIKELSDNS